MNFDLIEEISRFVREAPGNILSDSGTRYFDEPLTGFAAAEDPLFHEYKKIIGNFYLHPAEMVAASTPDDCWKPETVISWVLPISETVRVSNRKEKVFPSRLWAQTRESGEKLNNSLRRHVVEWLKMRGYKALAPQLSSVWREYSETDVGIASNWSERHTAFAAGLGTFSLNDALITTKGIAHRLGSVITDLIIAPSERGYRDYRANCLFYRDGSCGACINRCPIKALSTSGHNKNICREYVYGTAPAAVGASYGVNATGCGLCQTGVPCEKQIPFSQLFQVNKVRS